MKISIMQPALFPPASYLRLFAAADMFIFFDDVQFARRWYTHRQRLAAHDGSKQWCALPLKKMPQNAKISEMEFLDDFEWRWVKQSKRFPVLEGSEIRSDYTPLSFVINSILNACMELGIPLNVQLSSAIPTPDDLRGQDRILYICKALGATEYVNSPGGVSLYDPKKFEEAGVKLAFLPEWRGSYDSVLERLTDESAEDIRKEIYGQL